MPHSGRHGAPEGTQQSGPIPGAPPRAGQARPGGAARASASVVPPVVPGREGVRAPAVPGRAGAMADSPSGVVQRPGGGPPSRGTGRVPRPAEPGADQPGPATGSMPVRGGRARVTGPVDMPGDGAPVSPAQARAGAPAPARPDGGQTGARPPLRGTGRVGSAAVPGPAGGPPAGAPGPVGGGTGGRAAVQPGAARASARTAVPGQSGAASAGTARVPGVAATPTGPRPDGARPGLAPGGGARDGDNGSGEIHSGEIRGGAADSASGDDDQQAGGLQAARSQLRARRGLRVLVVAAVSVLLLGALPVLLGLRASGNDPVFASLNTLQVPDWAAGSVQDNSSGSRWCLIECRFRERTAHSQRPFEETARLYTSALAQAGWQPWKVHECPDQPITDGRYTCWRRDEYTLDLWVHLPECAADAVAAQDPAAIPSVGADGTVPDPAACTGSTVSIKVQNAISDQRRRPGTGESPGLTGETPDPVLSDDPLLDPTPSPS
ncbi:hypothetical protein GCM10012284_55370 [Mangrovihabitans endophyticus]|uniref:Integrin beta 3 n=1 Tax=Mangrovihabitans endophyticus TaxID=1751298 RepID=A0A8J3C3J4_9ACTN|nr:hypothetical protein GCM10012284_55370 [Mangrovihabitans endophyticus]